MTNRMLRRSAYAALLLVTGVANLSAQGTQPPARPAAQPGAQPTTGADASNTFRAKQVLGSKVMIAGNTGIGTVDDIVFDDAGNLEYLIVMDGTKLVTVPWEAAKFNLTEKVATVNLTADQYKVIPTYTTTTYPSFYTPAYRTEVYKMYNLTPRPLRRIERRIP